jgi:hypothetical protein
MSGLMNKINGQGIFFQEKVKDCLLKFFIANPRIYCLQRVLRSLNDANFRQQIMEIGHNPDVIQMHSYGELHPETNIYFIEVGNSKMGFGACYRYALYGLFFARQLGFTPVVRFAADSPYQEKEPIQGTNNPFEYYFRSTSDISVTDVFRSKRVFLHNGYYISRIEQDLGNPAPEIGTGYVVDEPYLQRLASLVRQYVVLNDYTYKYIEVCLNGLVSRLWKETKILGVQVRGTDFALNWNNHPNMIQPEEFFVAIDEAMDTNKFEYIFLATDDAHRVEAFQDRYGRKLIYFKDVHRGTKQINISLEENVRENNHYLNGLEVLRDIYALANCNGFIAGISQVSILARVIKYSLNSKYEYMKILDKGLYKT